MKYEYIELYDCDLKTDSDNSLTDIGGSCGYRVVQTYIMKHPTKLGEQTRAFLMEKEIAE